MPTCQYPPQDYAALLDDSARSARAVVPLIVRLFTPESVVDVGCGSGTWTRAFKEAGVKAVLGVDGAAVREDQLLVEAVEFHRQDLGRPFRLKRRFDLAVSLEVAEHLPAKRAKGFVADLCRLRGL